jgi:hypothetical protein
MTHSLEPSGFLPERLSAQAIWRWRLLDAAGEQVTAPETAPEPGPRFTSQSDAESWVGEVWQELAAEGVDAVVLLEGDREVYGPMSLHA